MAAKKLQEGSEYAEYDSNQDGVVSDSEIESSEKLLALRLHHERADAQRGMSWFALSQAAKILGDMAAVYFVSVAGILAAFFGAQAWSSRR